ncbi:hypothetical protein SAMN04489761_4544 [Tenacibaculum sp. MAR_2009_124]|nr:hypothetical protein SAMN04489761_4544 [Tenacibaculum sp. MAR_2009_124]
MLKKMLKATNAQKLSKQELKKVNGGHSHATPCEYHNQECTVYFNNIFGKYQEPGLCNFNGTGYVCVPQF